MIIYLLSVETLGEPFGTAEAAGAAVPVEDSESRPATPPRLLTPAPS